MLALRHAERSTPLVAPAVPGWLGPRARRALIELDVNVAPVSAVAVPCLMAFAARHPAYLHAGLWPVAPLAQPGLLRLDLALRRNGIPMLTGMLRESILVDLGYIDHAALAEQLCRAETGHPMPALFYDSLAVETGLRSMTGNPSKQP